MDAMPTKKENYYQLTIDALKLNGMTRKELIECERSMLRAADLFQHCGAKEEARHLRDLGRAFHVTLVNKARRAAAALAK